MAVKDDAESPVDAALDLDAAPVDEWSESPFPMLDPKNRRAVQIVVKRSVLKAIREHGLERTDVEICGVLVGKGYRDQRGPFLYVEAMIRGEHSANQAAQVTFTSETWNHIQDEMERSFSDKRILGWYHTHPGFGIFLSGMDMFIHNNFFNRCDQLALVYDPLSGEDGLFVWRRGEARRELYSIEEDAGAVEPVKDVTAGATPDERETADAEEPIRLRRRVNRMEWALAAALAIALLWPLVADRFDVATLIADFIAKLSSTGR